MARLPHDPPARHPGNQNREPAAYYRFAKGELYPHGQNTSSICSEPPQRSEVYRPKTAEGKARDSRNRLSHGFCSSWLFIAGQVPKQFNRLLAAPHDLAIHIRYRQSSDRAFYQARNELLSAQKERKKLEIGFVPQTAGTPVVETVPPPPTAPEAPQETTVISGVSTPKPPHRPDTGNLEKAKYVIAKYFAIY